MNHHVNVESLLQGEASATLGADEGFPCVDGLVNSELPPRAEHLPAVFAAQSFLLLGPTPRFSGTVSASWFWFLLTRIQKRADLFLILVTLT